MTVEQLREVAAMTARGCIATAHATGTNGDESTAELYTRVISLLAERYAEAMIDDRDAKERQ